MDFDPFSRIFATEGEFFCHISDEEGLNARQKFLLPGFTVVIGLPIMMAITTTGVYFPPSPG